MLKGTSPQAHPEDTQSPAQPQRKIRRSASRSGEAQRRNGNKRQARATSRETSSFGLLRLVDLLEPIELEQLKAVAMRSGAPAHLQIIGAVRSWLGFADGIMKANRELPAVALMRLREDPGGMDPEQIECVVDRLRARSVTPAAARLFLSIYKEQERRPLAESAPILEGLRDLVKGHQGFERETAALSQLLEGTEILADSYLAERARGEQGT